MSGCKVIISARADYEPLARVRDLALPDRPPSPDRPLSAAMRAMPPTLLRQRHFDPDDTVPAAGRAKTRPSALAHSATSPRRLAGWPSPTLPAPQREAFLLAEEGGLTPGRNRHRDRQRTRDRQEPPALRTSASCATPCGTCHERCQRRPPRSRQAEPDYTPERPASGEPPAGSRRLRSLHGCACRRRPLQRQTGCAAMVAAAFRPRWRWLRTLVLAVALTLSCRSHPAAGRLPGPPASAPG